MASVLNSQQAKGKEQEPSPLSPIVIIQEPVQNTERPNIVAVETFPKGAANVKMEPKPVVWDVEIEYDHKNRAPIGNVLLAKKIAAIHAAVKKLTHTTQTPRRQLIENMPIRTSTTRFRSRGRKTCIVCKKEFSKKALRNHLMWTPDHRGRKSIVGCDFCERIFQSTGSRSDHMRNCLFRKNPVKRKQPIVTVDLVKEEPLPDNDVLVVQGDIPESLIPVQMPSTSEEPFTHQMRIESSPQGL